MFARASWSGATLSGLDSTASRSSVLTGQVVDYWQDDGVRAAPE